MSARGTLTTCPTCGHPAALTVTAAGGPEVVICGRCTDPNAALADVLRGAVARALGHDVSRETS